MAGLKKLLFWSVLGPFLVWASLMLHVIYHVSLIFLPFCFPFRALEWVHQLTTFFSDLCEQVNYLTRMQVHKFRWNGAWSNLRCTMCQFLDICSIISSVFSILFLGRSWIQVDTLYFWPWILKFLVSVLCLVTKKFLDIAACSFYAVGPAQAPLASWDPKRPQGGHYCQ